MHLTHFPNCLWSDSQGCSPPVRAHSHTRAPVRMTVLSLMLACTFTHTLTPGRCPSLYSVTEGIDGIGRGSTVTDSLRESTSRALC